MGKWVRILELPKDQSIEGCRVRYNGHILGVIRSGWNKGLWIKKDSASTEVTPWLPPEGSMLGAAEKLEVEVYG